jgi:hypothetical protein
LKAGMPTELLTFSPTYCLGESGFFLPHQAFADSF